MILHNFFPSSFACWQLVQACLSNSPTVKCLAGVINMVTVIHLLYHCLQIIVNSAKLRDGPFFLLKEPIHLRTEKFLSERCKRSRVPRAALIAANGGSGSRNRKSEEER